MFTYNVCVSNLYIYVTRHEDAREEVTNINMSVIIVNISIRNLTTFIRHGWLFT